MSIDNYVNNLVEKYESRRQFLGNALQTIGEIATGLGFTTFYKPNTIYAQEKFSYQDANVRQQFRNLGWDVYDDKNDPLRLQPGKSDIVLKYRTTRSQFQEAFRQNKFSIREYFTKDELTLFETITDDSYDDKLLFTFVNPDGILSITLKSNDTSVGKNGFYVVRKKIEDETNLKIFKKISPDWSHD